MLATKCSCPQKLAMRRSTKPAIRCPAGMPPENSVRIKGVGSETGTTLTTLEVAIRQGDDTAPDFKNSHLSSFPRGLIAFAKAFVTNILQVMRDCVAGGIRNIDTLTRPQSAVRNHDRPVEVLIKPVDRTLTARVHGMIPNWRSSVLASAGLKARCPKR